MSWRNIHNTPDHSYPPSGTVPYYFPLSEGLVSRPSSALSGSQLSFSSPASQSSHTRLLGLLAQPSVVASPVESAKSISTKPKSASSLPRHSQFYLQDELSIFLVEGVLFRVHRYFLQRESDVFRTMFVCPPTQDGPEGCMDDRPIVLPEVTVAEFECLLKFFYEGNTSMPSPLSTADDWIRLLSISTRYSMERVRARALQELQDLPPLDAVRQIVLARKYDVREWLLPSYFALCIRRQPLNVLEAAELGLETMVLIAMARESVRDPDTLKDLENAGESMSYEDFMTDIVADVFGMRYVRESMAEA